MEPSYNIAQANNVTKYVPHWTTRIKLRKVGRTYEIIKVYVKRKEDGYVLRLS